MLMICLEFFDIFQLGFFDYCVKKIDKWLFTQNGNRIFFLRIIFYGVFDIPMLHIYESKISSTKFPVVV